MSVAVMPFSLSWRALAASASSPCAAVRPCVRWRLRGKNHATAVGAFGHRFGLPYVASHRAVDHSDMALLKRQALAMLGAGGGLLAMGYALRGIIGVAGLNRLSNRVATPTAPDSAVRPAWT